MTHQSRRSFLTSAAAGAAAMASSSPSFASTLARALAIPANNTTGTIADVEQSNGVIHVVNKVLMP